MFYCGSVVYLGGDIGDGGGEVGDSHASSLRNVKDMLYFRAPARQTLVLIFFYCLHNHLLFCSINPDFCFEKYAANCQLYIANGLVF